MPRLRQTYTIITDISQISEGDCIVYNGFGWEDVVGIVYMSIGDLYILDGEWPIQITTSRIFGGLVMKISSPERYSQLLLEKNEYHRVNQTLYGYRTGLFPCPD